MPEGLGVMDVMDWRGGTGGVDGDQRSSQIGEGNLSQRQKLTLGLGGCFRRAMKSRTIAYPLTSLLGHDDSEDLRTVMRRTFKVGWDSLETGARACDDEGQWARLGYSKQTSK